MPLDIIMNNEWYISNKIGYVPCLQTTSTLKAGSLRIIVIRQSELGAIRNSITGLLLLQNCVFAILVRVGIGEFL